MGSATINYCISNQLDAMRDWNEKCREENYTKSKMSVFPQRVNKGLSDLHPKYGDKFDPHQVNSNKTQINATVDSYNLFHEWLSKIFTIMDAVDLHGMLSEYVKRAMDVPFINSEGHYLGAVRCFDWGDLETNKPDFYKSLNLDGEQLELVMELATAKMNGENGFVLR